MLGVLIRRLVSSLAIIILAMASLIIVIHAVPGDPATILLGPHATPEMKAVLRSEMGLDKPIPVQIVTFIWNVLHGNLGTDVLSRRPVAAIVLEQLPSTLLLIFLAIIFATSIGIPLGCYSALHRGSWIDTVIGVISVGAIAVPAFVIAIYSVLIFSISLNWLPSIGAGEPGNFVDVGRHLILPVLSIGLNWIGYLARFVRAAMLDVLGERHIRSARAHGLRERTIIFRYALPLAVLPTITIIGAGIGYLLSAAVLTEIVFARPGIGKLLFDAVSQRNYPVVLGTVLVTTMVFVFCSILADIINAFIDPRAREQG